MSEFRLALGARVGGLVAAFLPRVWGEGGKRHRVVASKWRPPPTWSEGASPRPSGMKTPLTRGKLVTASGWEKTLSDSCLERGRGRIRCVVTLLARESAERTVKKEEKKVRTSKRSEQTRRCTGGRTLSTYVLDEVLSPRGLETSALRLVFGARVRGASSRLGEDALGASESAAVLEGSGILSVSGLRQGGGGCRGVALSEQWSHRCTRLERGSAPVRRGTLSLAFGARL
jgi:hypothetical protein